MSRRQANLKHLGRSLSRNRSQRNRYSVSDAPPVPSLQTPKISVADDELRASPINLADARPPSAPSQGLKRTGRRLSRDAAAEAGRNVVPINTALNTASDKYSESVADWNMSVNGQHYANRDSYSHIGQAISKEESPVSPVSPVLPVSRTSSRRLSHKPDVTDLRRLSDGKEMDGDPIPPRNSSLGQPAATQKQINRASLERALPRASSEAAPSQVPPVNHQQRSGVEDERHRRREYMVQSDTPIDPNDYVDLSNTEQTHVNVKWAPAVTHEVRNVDTHEIIQEAVTREIHNHHYYHRVLPIIDIEVLPARHFVPTADGGYREISEAEIPGGGNTDRLQQLIQEAVAKSMPQNNQPLGPRHFTARTFEGTEGDYKEYTTPDGQHHTEQWWVHPPTIETGAQESGQTLPFHFGSKDPEDDGIRGFQHDTPPGLRSLRESQAARSKQKSPELHDRFVTPPQSPQTHSILPFRMAHGSIASSQI